MNNAEYIFMIILVMTIATFATRLLPFILFHKHSEHPLMNYIAKYTPPMIMSILVLYVLKDVDFSSYEGLNTIIAIIVTITTHLVGKNPLISIFSGTFLYMFLVQM